MSYFEDTETLKDSSLDNNDRFRIVADRIRCFALALLEDGAYPGDVSYYLAYIATEMGLKLTTNSYKVFPMALGGMVDAGRDAIQIEITERNENATTGAKVVEEDKPAVVTH